MVELFGVTLSLFFIFKTARRRGGRGLILSGAGLVGYFAITFALTLMLHRPPGLYLIAAWAWLGLCFACAWFMTGGKTASDTTWSCPDCGMYNNPSTLVCECGHTFVLDE